MKSHIWFNEEIPMTSRDRVLREIERAEISARIQTATTWVFVAAAVAVLTIIRVFSL